MKNMIPDYRGQATVQTLSAPTSASARVCAISPPRHRLGRVAGILLLAALLSLMMAPPKVLAAVQDSAPDGAFTPDLKQWKERSFKGNTDYRVIEDGGVPVLRGETQGQASVLYRKQKIDLKATPVVYWSWKVDRTYQNIDERTRNGDDFPARMYVVAKTGLLPWETVAINYVWSSQSPLDESWANPFTDKARMVVVESGEQFVGQWVSEQRNVAEDFQRYFDLEVEELSGYAVMVDGDNSNREAVAWFGEIRFSAN